MGFLSTTDSGPNHSLFHGAWLHEVVSRPIRSVMAPRDLLVELGSSLRAHRLARKLTQGQVAARAGFTGKYLSEIERGTRDVPLGTLHAIVHKGLGMSLEIRCGPSRGAAQRGTDEVMRSLTGLAESERRDVLAILRATLRLVLR
jgi:transcriptional regulator with XRE-family HTH domain